MASSYQYSPQQSYGQSYNPYQSYNSNSYGNYGQNQYAQSQYGQSPFGQSPFSQYVNPLQTTFTGVNYSLPSNYDIVPWPTAELTADLNEFEKHFRNTDNSNTAFHRLSASEQRNIRFAAFHNADARAVRIIQVVENSLGPNPGNVTTYNNWFTSPTDAWAGNAMSNWYGVQQPVSGWNNYPYNGAYLGGPTPPYYYAYDQFGGYDQQYNQSGYPQYNQMQGGYYPQQYNQMPVNNYWNNQYSF